MTDIIRLQAFKDNYIWILRDKDTSAVVVDPGDAKPVIEYLNANQLKLKSILITHHHFDHCGGIKDLLKFYSGSKQDIPIFGGFNEPIPFLSQPLKEGDTISNDIANDHFSILEIPGHTLGHIAYVSDTMLFCGDTLFTAGCGRLFEGTAAQMLHSLNKLKKLPPNIKVFCGHEYTLQNLKFAMHIEPNNQKIKERLSKVEKERALGQATVPALLEIELDTNPFLRTDKDEIKENAYQYARNYLNEEINKNNEEAVFAVIRIWKNNF